MGDPVKIITFGGAKFDENQIASKSTVQKNGRTYYIVNFKTGGKVEFPAQAPGNNAAIDVGRGEAQAYVGSLGDGKVTDYMYDHLGQGNYADLTGGEGAVYQNADKYTISRFWGLEFTGTQRPDNVTLHGCTRCKVDVRGGNSRSGDQVYLEKDSRHGSYNNEVIMDANDTVAKAEPPYIVPLAEGAGTYHEGDTRDKLK